MVRIDTQRACSTNYILRSTSDKGLENNDAEPDVLYGAAFGRVDEGVAYLQKIVEAHA